MDNMYYTPFEPQKPEPLPAKVFDRNIHEGIKVVRKKDYLDITLPVGLTDCDEPFHFTCHEIDKYTLEFRDGGQTLKSLAKRVDVSSYEKRIKEYCKAEGRLTLKGGREMVLTIHPQGKYYMMWNFYDFIYFCSTIANFDLYPTSYNMAMYGREDIDG